MLSAILTVFILNYLTTHVVCHHERVYSKLLYLTTLLSAILTVFILNYLTIHVVCRLECVYSGSTRLEQSNIVEQVLR